ncbi:T9SS type A sorting domain-containing protein [Taibaiella lutea]|uniref:T9SS type A sorting domain-containing protein n=1 Tax=Taibaiella lutea TaxID=2608001 RepID=A0A5M6CQU9_9BACT|nr:T9SS type A sorting domain-containing protein [Taibaiella lutea]KAA5536322.1 T9SS type A sorting domain-containing protein [Taibaiella lutea]
MKLCSLLPSLKRQGKIGLIVSLIYLLPHTVSAQCNTNLAAPVDGSRCGPGQVQLTATAPGTNTINWYQQATGGIPLGSGSPFTTPFVPVTTTFYATAVSGTSVASVQVGSGTDTLPNSTPGGPFTNWYRNEGTQMLYTANDIVTNGGNAGFINSVAFNCVNIPLQNGNTTLTSFPNYKISVAVVPASANTLTTWEPASSFSVVYTNSSFMPALGWNVFTFNTPIAWNGTDNIIIQICYDQTQPSYSSGVNGEDIGKHEYTSTQDRMLYFNDDNVSTSCGETGYNSSEYLPNAKFNLTMPCEGPRVPVTAAITPGPTFTKSAPEVVCNNAIGAITVTSPLNNYSNYDWSPAADLYTDAAATVPYAGGNATTLYFKSAEVGQHSFFMYATNTAAPNCAFADTTNIWVQPDSASILAIYDTICISGTSDLVLIPSTGYAPGSIQWTESSDNIGYNDINGATNTGLTTPTLTAEHYYKPVISATSGICLDPKKHIVIANPQLLSTKDSFNCGPGTVVLEADADAVSTLRWYDSPTSTQVLGSGSPFTTPYLSATTQFYVSAGAGAPQPDPTKIGSNSNTADWSAMPYYSAYSYGNKVQWKISAAEMNTAGFNAGYITSVGFTVGSYAGDPCENFTLSMKNIPSGGLGGSFQTGLQTVFSVPSYQPVTGGLNDHVLQVPFYWDGTSDIVLEECHINANISYNYTEVEESSNAEGMSNTAYSYDATHCSNPDPNNTYTTSDRPNITITMKPPCETPRQPVIAYIHPKPVVDLGTDINICVDEPAFKVLDAGVQPNDPSFLWDDNTTSQIHLVNEDGTYYVKVTNSFGCQNSDTIHVQFRINPVVNLGNDTSICNGATVTLDAGPQGVEYFWNTGQATQTITVNSAGLYTVFVTNDKGCIKSDTIEVETQGQLPTIQGIEVSNNGNLTFTFHAVNPQNVIGYDWDFGDGTQHSYESSPIHTYQHLDDYMVTLNLSSSCGFSTVQSSAHIVGINQLNISNDELMVFPNPSRGEATILNKGSLNMKKIQVYNILGQVIYSANADSKDKHSLNLNGFTAGIYTIEIYTDKGSVSRKLEILK